jgi:uncharacterized surface protein with fasciclin (FAS1) repeats
MSTILQIVNADRNLSTLIKGVKATDLEEILNGVGPFTIFAPVNLAFSRLSPDNSFEELIKNGDKTRLSDILTYHVIAGKKMLRDFRNGQKLKTINGKDVDITVTDGEVSINGAKILSKDRQGSNGIIHSVDAVNMPGDELPKNV